MTVKAKKLLSSTAIITSFLVFSPKAQADSKDAFIDALKDGKVIFDARYRYENVDDASVADEANASTLRTRLGYETAKLHGFSGLLEFSNTTVVGSESYNDTLNGKTTRAVVGDPEGTAVNRALIQYHNIPQTVITVGRQTLTLDNERFVTNGNFRQKQKTFDQAHLVTDFIPHVKVNYAYMWATNDNTSSDQDSGDFDTNNHVINVSTDIIPNLRVAGYAYLLDFDNVSANSLDTYGIHFDGSYPVNDDFSILYQGDWAKQEEAANNTANIDFNFYLIEPGIKYKKLTLKGGYLNFEGDGTNAFQTPIGDAHPYSGWADVFGTTPANGLEEYYAKVSYTCNAESIKYLDAVTLSAEYHNFEAENTSTDYGEEWDVALQLDIAEHYTASVEYASFSADSGSGFSDVDKLWLTVGVNF